MRYAIFGSGGFGRELAPLAREAAETVSPAQESPRLIPSIVFVSDDIEEVGTTKNGILVISFDDLANNYRDHNLILAVGDPATRKRIADRCSMAGLSFGKLYAKQLDSSTMSSLEKDLCFVISPWLRQIFKLGGISMPTFTPMLRMTALSEITLPLRQESASTAIPSLKMASTLERELC